MTSPVQVVRELMDAHATGGIEAFLDAAGEDVTWQPFLSDGRIYRSTSELRTAFVLLLEEGLVYEIEIDGIEQHGDVVIVGGTVRAQFNGKARDERVHWGYHFRQGRLWRQSTHASREDALETIRVLRSLGANFAIAEDEGEGGEHVLRVKGELDIATAPDLERVLLTVRPRGERVVLDLAGLRFMDSTGLRVLLRAQAAARDGRWELYLRDVPPNIGRLFTIAGVEDALPPAEPFVLGD
jgi:anti-anti-sigma factor